jgi:hypothetical protein
LSLLVAVGCAEATFSAHSRDNSVEDIRRALAASRAPTAGPQGTAGRPMAFLVTSDRQLVGYDFAAGKPAWQENANVRSRVVVGRGLIAHRTGDSELVGRDPASGKVLFTAHLAAGEKFVGAAIDDEQLYYVVQASGEHRTSWVIALDHTGHELWRTSMVGSMSAPAARGGVVAVPNVYQNVSLLDGKTGKELARIRNTDEQITFVRALPEGFFYGGTKGVYLLDDKSASGSQKGSSFVAAKFASEQVRTFYYWDGYQSAQADYSAFDRNRLVWRAEPRGGTVGFHDDTAYLHSYRYFFSFDTKEGKLRWAYAHPRVDMVATELSGPCVVFASVDGDVGALDVRSGAVRAVQKTGLKLVGAAFDVDGYEGGAVSDKPDLLKTLEKIVWDPDARFNAVKVFCVDAIGDLAGAATDAALLKVVLKERGVPALVQKKAGEELVARKNAEAAPLIVEALHRRYDHLEDQRPQGVDVLARTAAAIGAKDAVPELAAHLADPATPPAALKDIAAALAALGGKPAAAALRELLVNYRADPLFLVDPAPLTIAGEALLKFGDATDRRAVEFIAEEPRTLPPVGRYLKTAIADALARAALGRTAAHR